MLIGGHCRERGNQTLVVAESPHFVTHLLILVTIPFVSHFLTTPDETSSSERAVANVATCDRLDKLCPNDCAITALLSFAGMTAMDGRRLGSIQDRFMSWRL